MRTKVILMLVILILLFVAIYAAMLVLGSPRAEAPASSELQQGEPATPASGFNGPTGVPYVKGPSEPPTSSEP